MSAEHTPIPWKIGTNRNTHYVISGGTVVVARCETFPVHSVEIGEANAEFIVRAVNNFDALLAASKEALISLGYLSGYQTKTYLQLRAAIEGAAKP